MNSPRMICLMYHDAYIVDKHESGFITDSANVYKIKREAFECQINLINSYIQRNQIDKDLVRFTFDDGGVSAYTIFAPILEKYGYKGYFFIASKFINKAGFLSEKQIIDLDKRGHIIGGHSNSHRQRMNELPFHEILEDWRICTNRLEQILGHQVVCCSLPCGYSSESMLRALCSLGYLDIYTSDAIDKVKQVNGIQLHGRYGIRESMSNQLVLNLVASPFVRSKLKMRKQILSIAKILLGKKYLTLREMFYQFNSCIRL